MLGVIDFRLDADLIEYLAVHRPDWSFALVGLVKGDAPLARLRALPNVHILGFKPMEDLPGYLKGMDVCLIPYALNEYTHHVFPLKLYDYMAAGRPIVASDMAELRHEDGNGFVIARTGDEFLGQIERAVAEDGLDRVAARQELARLHTWDHRVEQISAIIDTVGRTTSSPRALAVPPTKSAKESA
jgi:glycosyltransferase involved in cell wall biosynthesis